MVLELQEVQWVMNHIIAMDAVVATVNVPMHVSDAQVVYLVLVVLDVLAKNRVLIHRVMVVIIDVRERV